MAESSHRVTILVAIIGVVGTIGAALIANWDKIFPPRPAVTDSKRPSPPPENASPSPPKPTEVSYPEKTVRELLTAWKQSDRNAALKVAKSGAVDKLFSASSLDANSKDLTCYVVGEYQRDCQISYKDAILVFRLSERDQGWWVESVEY